PEAARQCNELIRLFAEECAVRAAGAAKARLAVAETKQKQQKKKNKEDEFDEAEPSDPKVVEVRLSDLDSGWILFNLMSSSTPDRHLLVLVLDLNPAWWGLQTDTDVCRMLQSVLTFANAHLLVQPGNEVALLGVCGEQTQFLYPAAQSPPGGVPLSQQGPAQTDGAKLECFTAMNDCVKDAADSLMRSVQPEKLRLSVCMAGCLVKALCYIARREREIQPGVRLASRVLLLRGCRDEASQYMALMNAVFAAQKRQIPIDACVISSDSTLLRQAAELSGGFYLRLPRPSALLQCLLSLFLAEPAVRQASLTLPPSLGPSDSRPACFCHRKLVSIAHVCSICLSVYCSYTPLCTTCHATFPKPQLPAYFNAARAPGKGGGGGGGGGGKSKRNSKP
uniref:General transcription factor IIH subunit 3 n=1 Tax=Macrostomum lignano TaxID=282301 RepID=A0A1I8GS65_9PLAT